MKLSNTSLNADDDTLVIDWENTDFAVGQKEGLAYVLVIDKSDHKILTAIEAQYFEGMVDFYMNAIYGTYIEKDISVQ